MSSGEIPRKEKSRQGMQLYSMSSYSFSTVVFILIEVRTEL